jgi:hypothetical protein
MNKEEKDKIKADKIRRNWLKHPPEGYSKKEIERMSDNTLLDIDYFLSESIEDIFENAEMIDIIGFDDDDD